MSIHDLLRISFPNSSVRSSGVWIQPSAYETSKRRNILVFRVLPRLSGVRALAVATDNQTCSKIFVFFWTTAVSIV
jgi:hypothetical protein